MGLVVPIPTFPVGVTVSKLAPVDDVMDKGVMAPLPCTANVDATVLVPMLKYLLVLSQYRLELFWFIIPLAPANKIEPWVIVAIVTLPAAVTPNREDPLVLETRRISALWLVAALTSIVICVVLELAFWKKLGWLY